MTGGVMRRSALFALFAKTAFGMGVFVSTVAGWSLVAPHLSAHRPLPDADGPDGRCAIWFVGSSSIHRWTSMHADMAPWSVRNRGVNGALMSEVSARFQNEAVTTPPDAIVFYLGENDIAAGASADDVEGAVAHLAQIAARRMPGTMLFVIGLKPSPARWSQRAEQRRFNARARTWAAKEGGVTFLDIGDALLVDGIPGRFYQPDGIHLDADGYRVWAHRLRRGIERALPAAQVRRCAGRATA